MVSETTETSITWTWDAVEGALGYVVQANMDEMWDDTDTVMFDGAPFTTMTSYTAMDLEPETTVYVRVAAGGGSLEAPLVSAFTTHVSGTSAMPPPPPPPPMAPATPTGLMAEEGEGSITWSWDAVEGADGYAVQVSMDEMFDDMDETTYTMETSHTVEDLGYGETRFARVASTSGEGEDMLKSMFTTHVTGMSMAEPPPPPPPAPDPVEVTFTLPAMDDDEDCGGYAMCPDEETDEAKAMASVNTMITVTSNSTAVVLPMFDETANPVKLHEGENMPFKFVSWKAMQSQVVSSEGVTFKVMRVTVGANQEMEPSGDVAYVTCGPFACQDGMDAPEITIANSAACEGWEPELQLEVGLVDNDGFDGDDDGAGDVLEGVTEAADGYDMGWAYTSSGKFNTTHDFGPFDSVEVKGVADGTDKAISMKAVKDVVTVDINVAPTDGFPGAGDTYACEPDRDYTGQDATTTRGIDKPRSCFRLHADKDYLSSYEVTLSLASGGVSWGSVDWEENPFKDLTCEPMTVVATDAMDVDVCELFEEEVDAQHSKDLTIIGRVTGSGTTLRLSGVDVAMPGSDSERYTQVWYHDGSKTSDKATLRRLQSDFVEGDATAADRVGHAVSRDGLLTAATNAANESTVDSEDVGTGFVPLVDDDNDPIYGDIGKVDHDGAANSVGGDDEPNNFLATDDAAKCSADDGGKAESKDGENDGTLCDAEDVPIDFTVVFVDNFGKDGHGCMVEKTYTMTCDWDADGGLNRVRTPDATPDAALTAAVVEHYIDCTIEEN